MTPLPSLWDLFSQACVVCVVTRLLRVLRSVGWSLPRGAGDGWTTASPAQMEQNRAQGPKMLSSCRHAQELGSPTKYQLSCTCAHQQVCGLTTFPKSREWGEPLNPYLRFQPSVLAICLQFFPNCMWPRVHRLGIVD